MRKVYDNAKKIAESSWGIYAITLIIHLYTALQMKMIHLSDDEMGVLGIAAFLNGEDWSHMISSLPYYGYGTALIYAPIFALTKSPIIRYRLVVIINAVLVSLISVLAYRILNRFLHIRKQIGAAIGILTGCFTGYLVYTKWAWNETLLCVIPWLLLYLLLYLEETEQGVRKWIASMLLAFIAIYSYAVHGRGIVCVLAVLFIIVLYALVYKKILVNVFAFGLTFLLSWIGYKFFRQFFLSHLWWSESGEGLRNTMSSETGKFAVYQSFAGMCGLIKVAFGQLYSICVSTYGLIVVFAILGAGAIFALWKKRRDTEYGENRKEMIFFLFTFLLVMGAWGISCLSLGVNGHADWKGRGDAYIYIRYISNTLGMIVCAAMYMVHKYGLTKKKCGIVLLGLGGILGGILTLAQEINSQGSYIKESILLLIPYFDESQYPPVNFVEISVSIAIIAGVILYLMYRKKMKWSCFILFAVSIYAYLNISTTFLIPESELSYERVCNIAEVLGSVEGLESKVNKIYLFDKDYEKPHSGSALQFMLPNYEVYAYDEEDGSLEDVLEQLEVGDIVVSGVNLELEKTADDIWGVESDCLYRTDYLWVKGEELADCLADEEDVQLYRTYVEKPRVDLVHSYMDTGRITGDGKLASTGDSGFLMHGERGNGEAGRYKLTIDGKVHYVWRNRKIFTDLIGDGGIILLDTTSLMDYVDDDGVLHAEFVVDIPEYTEKIEPRLSVEKGIWVTIDRVEITYLED